MPKKKCSGKCPIPGKKSVAGIIRLIRDKRVRAFAELLDETGLRLRELLSVEKPDINFPGRFLNISPGKTMEGIARQICLSKRSVTLLKQNISTDHTRIFPGLTLVKIQNEWRKASNGCGVDVRIHDLRHTGLVTRLNKMDPRMVARMMNMSAITTMDHYLSLAPVKKTSVKPIGPLADIKNHRIIDADCGSGKTNFLEHLVKKGVLKKKTGALIKLGRKPRENGKKGMRKRRSGV